MHAIILSVLLGVAPAPTTARDAELALREAVQKVDDTRARWDEAVAGDHPVPAGHWARKHFAAMREAKAARHRLDQLELARR